MWVWSWKSSSKNLVNFTDNNFIVFILINYDEAIVTKTYWWLCKYLFSKKSTSNNPVNNIDKNIIVFILANYDRAPVMKTCWWIYKYLFIKYRSTDGYALLKRREHSIAILRTVRFTFSHSQLIRVRFRLLSLVEFLHGAPPSQAEFFTGKKRKRSARRRFVWFIFPSLSLTVCTVCTNWQWLLTTASASQSSTNNWLYINTTSTIYTYTG